MKKAIMLAVVLVLSMTMLISLTVDGYVTDSVTGLGIEGASVRFMLADGSGCGGNGGNGGNGGGGNGGGGCGGGNGGMNTLFVQTDADGYYTLTDLEAGTYNAVARKPGSYVSSHLFDLEIEEDMTVNFELEPGSCAPTFERTFRSGK
jgi:hypothetical protein